MGQTGDSHQMGIGQQMRENMPEDGGVHARNCADLGVETNNDLLYAIAGLHPGAASFGNRQAGIRQQRRLHFQDRNLRPGPSLAARSFVDQKRAPSRKV